MGKRAVKTKPKTKTTPMANSKKGKTKPKASKTVEPKKKRPPTPKKDSEDIAALKNEIHLHGENIALMTAKADALSAIIETLTAKTALSPATENELSSMFGNEKFASMSMDEIISRLLSLIQDTI